MLNTYKYYTCLILILLLLGCTPLFDWRVVNSDDGWEAIFPKKPLKKKRIIDLFFENQIFKIEISRYFCKVENITFVIETSKYLTSKNTNSIHALEKKLLGSMKENYSISYKKNIEEIKIFDGHVKSNYKKNKVDLKIATLYKIIDDKVLRGVVLSDPSFFNEEHAVFFLKSIK